MVNAEDCLKTAESAESQPVSDAMTTDSPELRRLS
jgi:hypothetical protein